MNIGFDAKRAYHNQTGLGHYSRTLINSLAAYFPEHQYYLFNPRASNTFYFDAANIKEILPSSYLSHVFSAAWRTNWIKNDLKKNKVNLFHGLSHEIPVNIHRTNIKSVVTIHDLIPERNPEQYSFIDRTIYKQKFRYACKYADKIIAISNQTKQDIIDFYKTDEAKITVCYQSCNPRFETEVSLQEKERIKHLYQLPDHFFLYTGSIIERKNLLNICKALQLVWTHYPIKLVVIGNGGSYKKTVKEYIEKNNLQDKIIFLSEQGATNYLQSYRSAADFPAIYQQATAMIYPSFFEGFGIPVLEALFSRIPVITSNISCLPEAGGNGAFYVNPQHAEEIAAQMKKIIEEKELVKQQIEKGWQHAQKFSLQKTATAVMDVYKEMM